MSLLRRWNQEERSREGRFLVIAVLAYVTYLAVYQLLRNLFTVSSSSLLLIGAILAGDVVNYLGSRYWVFQKTAQAVYRQGFKFFFVMVLTLVLQTFCFWFGRHWLLLPEPILLVFLPGLRMILNYLLHRGFTFFSPSSLGRGSAIY